ncbi:phage baseplate assembly protein [Methylomonas fluvii]|uniref:Phage tail protein n=1 Tax=Methylomonas fluvii TaxID=1854564 RepID=A0ABR9DKP8_9GAMM|nr:phage tail protein [Methylomonas fluvii]MBD9362903.1 phage tail protein [Methylomonas fluvii]
MVEIKFNGKRYAYWQQVSISASVDDLAASVQLGVTRSGTGERLGINENSVVEVLIADTVVATIRPDMVNRHVNANSHSIAIEARSLGRELVDCQYSQTLSGLKLAEIVKRLCSTFNVPVQIDADTTLVPDFALQCESPANALINAARAANLLLYATPDGGLKLTEPTSAAPVATLVYGEQIEQFSVVDEYKLRFSEYLVKGYDYASDKALKGGVKDAGIGYFRPLHIMADKAGQSLGGCDRRAELERNRRKARAHRIDLDVYGWTHAGGVWEINTQVRVVIPDEDIDGVYLIGDRAFSLDDQQGSMTRLTVMRREAFLGEEAPAKAKKAAKHKKAKSKPIIYASDLE